MDSDHNPVTAPPSLDLCWLRNTDARSETRSTSPARPGVATPTLLLLPDLDGGENAGGV